MIQLQDFMKDLELEGAEILEFWMREVIDIGNVRIYGQVNNDNSKDPEATISGVLISRLVWTFSKAYGYYKKDRYLEYAEFCYNYLIDNFWDHKFGGVYWEVTPDGDVVDSRKQLYVQAFAVYALSEFYKSTLFDDALEKGHQLYTLMEANGKDREYGGYIEGCLRNWEPATDLILSSKEEGSMKTMNTHLHIMESFANLLEAEHDAHHPEMKDVRSSLGELLPFMINRIYDEKTGHLDLYFTDDWRVTKSEYSPGHDIEAAWLLTEALHILQDSSTDEVQLAAEQKLAEKVQKTSLNLIDSTLSTGMRENGSIITDYPAEEEYTGYINTTALSDWWPQAEAWTGFLEAYSVTKSERYLTAARKTYDWGVANLKDKTGGEWYFGINPDGSLSKRGKAGFWKCPYHSWRACHEGVKRIQALL